MNDDHFDDQNSIHMSSPSRPKRKSRNVPPMRLMDDMEYYPPMATSGKMEIKEEQCSTKDVSPTKRRKLGTPEKRQAIDMPMNLRMGNGDPKKSYTDIIKEALLLAEDNILSLDQIYDFVWEKYPRKIDPVRWKESLRKAISKDRHSSESQFQLVSGQVGLRFRSCPDSVLNEQSENQEKPDEDELLVNRDEFKGNRNSTMAKQSRKVELDGITESDFGLNVEDPEEVHQPPFFQRVVIVPAGSEAQLRIQKILDGDKNPMQLPNHYTASRVTNNAPMISEKRIPEEGKNFPFPSECHKCGKDLSDLKVPKDHISRCGKSQGKSGPMCPKCGKHFPYGTSDAHLKRHTDICDPIGKICRNEHEHQLLDKVFDSLEEAIAHFYDNEYDSEFCKHSTQYKDRSRKRSVPSGTSDINLHFQCNRSGTKSTDYQPKKPRTSRKLDEKCTAKITINQNTNALNGEKVTRMYGCMAHNHPNNPTMKTTSWVTKRKIAKYLLLGHSRQDITYKLMPKFQREGQKKVDLAVVNRVQKKMSEDKNHKLREGHNLASLLGKDFGGDEDRRVYPWPTQTNCPLRNAKQMEHCQKKIGNLIAYNKTKRAHIMNISSPLKSSEQQEVESAISSISENIGRETEPGPGVANQGKVRNVVEDTDVLLAEPATDSHEEVSITSSKTDAVGNGDIITNPDRDTTLSDDAIDPQAFETLRQKALRLTERLTPTISGLTATGAGMAELQTILKSSLFELMCDDLDPVQERPPPKPENAKTYESYKRRVAEGRTIPKNYKRPIRIPDEKLLANL